MMKKKDRRKEKGFSLIEIIVAVSVLAVLFLAIGKYFAVSAEGTRHALFESKAGYLLEEGVEAVKLLRDENFAENIATLSSETPYYLSFDGISWTATTTSTVGQIDGMTRSFELADVYRDANGNIASAGTLDPGTKKLTMTVTWKNAYQNGTSTQSLQAYVMDLYND